MSGKLLRFETASTVVLRGAEVEIAAECDGLPIIAGCRGEILVARIIVRHRAVDGQTVERCPPSKVGFEPLDLRRCRVADRACGIGVVHHLQIVDLVGICRCVDQQIAADARLYARLETLDCLRIIAEVDIRREQIHRAGIEAARQEALLV